MNKKWKIVIAAATALILAAGIIAMALLIPVGGKKNKYVWNAADAYSEELTSTVMKDPDKDFKIMVIADIQLWSDKADNESALNMVRELAGDNQPNLIVTVGDNVSGLNTLSLVKEFIRVMEEIGIPWAPVFGNHDNEGKASINYQGDLFEAAEHCLFKKGPNNLYGVGNYVITIKESGKIIKSLFMFDNGRYHNYKEFGKKEVYMSEEQIAWYKWNVAGLKALNGGVTVPSMTFSHFAPPEFGALFQKESADGRYYADDSIESYGSCAYPPCVAPVNTGFFTAAKEGGTTHMFFGHDHESDARVYYDEMHMGYCLKTGPSPAPWNDAKEYGATFINIGRTGVDIQNMVHSKAK